MPILKSTSPGVNPSTLSLLCLLILAPAMLAQAAKNEESAKTEENDEATLAIVTGYGETTWGQPLAAVQEIWPDGKVMRQPKMGIREAYTKYTVPGADDGPIKERVAYFLDDQLNRVVVVHELPDRPENGADEEGLALIKELLDKKYHPTPKATRQLQVVNRMTIHARTEPNGSIHVMYENLRISENARKALKEEAAERRVTGTRTKKLKALGLEEGL